MGKAPVILGRRRSAALPQFGRADLRVRPNIHSESNHPRFSVGRGFVFVFLCALIFSARELFSLWFIDRWLQRLFLFAGREPERGDPINSEPHSV